MSFADDPHSERGFACPANKFGITDYAELRRYEEPLVTTRLFELEYRGISGKFDVAHLKSIHRYLFQDVFPWAGEFRVVNISKGNSMFGPARFIEGTLGEVMSKLKNEHFLRGLDAHAFSSRGANYLGEINTIHPLREGNGRTQRELIRQLALAAGHPLSRAGFTQKEMVNASILSHTKGDSSRLAVILSAAILSNREGSKTKQ